MRNGFIWLDFQALIGCAKCDAGRQLRGKGGRRRRADHLNIDLADDGSGIMNSR